MNDKTFDLFRKKNIISYKDELIIFEETKKEKIMLMNGMLDLQCEQENDIVLMINSYDGINIE